MYVNEIGQYVKLHEQVYWMPDRQFLTSTLGYSNFWGFTCFAFNVSSRWEIKISRTAIILRKNHLDTGRRTAGGLNFMVYGALVIVLGVPCRIEPHG